MEHANRLAEVWKLVALRGDIDSIITELVGHFSLENVYAKSNKTAYQHLVKALLSQLSAVIHIQRLSLPSGNQQISRGFLASWELIARSVDFVLQVVIDGRDSFWGDQLLWNQHLAEFLLSSLRLLQLIPKGLESRQERFGRIHCLLENVFNICPVPRSFLLSIAREFACILATAPGSVGLPPILRDNLPNLGSKLVSKA